jgi:hypothetical protein
MAEKKYAKHLTINPFWQTPTGKKMISTRHMEQFFGGNFSIDCAFIKEPVLMIPKAHKHDFDQYIMFFGANHDDIGDFDARIEMTLGEEKEMQIINSPTIVYVPAGMRHGPLNFAVIKKPVLFVDVASSNKYYRVWEDK